MDQQKLKSIFDTLILKANAALQNKNYPIASAITDLNGNILSLHTNENTTQNDVTAHAEILCIRECGITRTGKDNGSKTILVSTLEPCFGCSFFIARTNIQTIYSALKDPHKGGISDLKIMPQFENFFQNIEIINNPFQNIAEEQKRIMRDFFIKKGAPEKAEFYA